MSDVIMELTSWGAEIAFTRGDKSNSIMVTIRFEPPGGRTYHVAEHVQRRAIQDAKFNLLAEVVRRKWLELKSAYQFGDGTAS